METGSRVIVNTGERLKWANFKKGTVTDISHQDPLDPTITVLLDDMDKTRPPFGLVCVKNNEIFDLCDEEGEEKNDPVNHPGHYTSGKYECIDYIESCGYHKDGYLFNAVKYISRAGKKDPSKKTEDIEKAIWYLTRKIETENEAKTYIQTDDYISDLGLEGSPRGLALKLIERQDYDLAVDILKWSISHEKHP